MREKGLPGGENNIQRMCREVGTVYYSGKTDQLIRSLQDGRLSNDEFVAVVRRRLQRGLERPRDTGLFRFIEATVECTKKRLP